jgi:hypothetical protein
LHIYYKAATKTEHTALLRLNASRLHTTSKQTSIYTGYLEYTIILLPVEDIAVFRPKHPIAATISYSVTTKLINTDETNIKCLQLSS